MAVSSLQYTMGISSGFKVYILEGQHSARNADRLRPLTNHGIPVYPIKRKLSPETVSSPKRCCPSSFQRREKTSTSPIHQKCATRQKSSNPTAFGPHITLEHVLKRLMPERNPLERNETQQNEDQPLALVKRLEKTSRPPPMSSAMLQQMRPSVITCISRPKSTTSPTTETTNLLRHSEVQRSSTTCSDVEEHFKRSLKSYSPQPSIHCPPPQQSARNSVEEHFSKALGSRWLLIRAAADSATQH
ncbi:transcription cofactor vestigial-like protein 4 [Pseudophryne corroboree]|uniref:transcription cofactor vestigial-like protein 4 n=1 Tax=Pseudophryne corroboree TaxID=495146 RepID=UPI003081491E